MPLMRCFKCGDNYPDRLAACPKCGANTPAAEITSKERKINLLKLFAAGILLVITGILFILIIALLFDRYFLSAPDFIELIIGILFFVTPVILITGVILTFSALVVFLLSIGYRRKEFWVLLTLIVITTMLVIKLIYEEITADSDDYYFKGSVEEAIPYAEKIIPLLDEFKNITGSYPFNLDYLDANFEDLLKSISALSDEPSTLSLTYLWIGYYPITTQEYVLCVEERDKINDHYSSFLYSSRDRQWRKSDCNIYHGKYNLQIGGVERNAIVISKETVNRVSKLYRVQFQNGATLDIVSMRQSFSIGECVKVYIQDSLHPRLALGDNCWN